MTNKEKLEKVIKGLECCNPNEYHCGVCPYDDGYESCARCKLALHSDALALLKAQEPMNAIVVLNGIDRNGGWWYQCQNCKMEIEPRDKYCKNCGQAVKWA